MLHSSQSLHPDLNGEKKELHHKEVKRGVSLLIGLWMSTDPCVDVGDGDCHCRWQVLSVRPCHSPSPRVRITLMEWLSPELGFNPDVSEKPRTSGVRPVCPSLGETHGEDVVTRGHTIVNNPSLLPTAVPQLPIMSVIKDQCVFNRNQYLFDWPTLLRNWNQDMLSK